MGEEAWAIKMTRRVKSCTGYSFVLKSESGPYAQKADISVWYIESAQILMKNFIIIGGDAD